MHLTYSTKSTTDRVYLNEIIVVHDEEAVVFHEQPFYKSEEKDHHDTFAEINGYIAACIPRDTQKRMFDIYKEIKETLDTVKPEPKALIPILSPLVIELYSYTSIVDLNVWMYKNRLHHVPSIIPEVIPSGKEYPPETTYVKDEYIGIINLSVLLHLAAPFLGDYINKISRITGGFFKEPAGLELLEYTSVMDTKAMHKLREYITASCSKKPVPLSAALEGLSEERFPEWLLGNIVARKLAINHVRRGDDNGHIVAAIHAYIGYNTKLDGKFGGGIMPKDHRELISDDERDKPVIENWKMKTDIYETDICVCAVGFDDLVLAGQTIVPGITAKIINRCIRAIPKGWNMELSPHQRYLADWVISMTDYAPPETMDGYYDYDVSCKIIGLAQAVFWHLGYPQLAVFVATSPAKEVFEYSRRTIDSVPAARKLEVESLYGVMLDKRSGPNDGLVSRTLDEIVSSLTNGIYTVSGPDELLAESMCVDIDRQLIVPSDVNFKLLDFIQFVATNNQK